MLNIEFKECCINCKFIDVNVESETYNNYIGDFTDNTTIGCTHQFVCKEYKEQTTDKRLVHAQ